MSLKCCADPDGLTYQGRFCRCCGIRLRGGPVGLFCDRRQEVRQEVLDPVKGERVEVVSGLHSGETGVFEGPSKRYRRVRVRLHSQDVVDVALEELSKRVLERPSPCEFCGRNHCGPHYLLGLGRPVRRFCELCGKQTDAGSCPCGLMRPSRSELEAIERASLRERPRPSRSELEAIKRASLPERPRPSRLCEGHQVRVIDGPFANFNGTVEEVNPENGRVRVLVNIFGRVAEFELTFEQVEAIE
jgi:transcription antitermination factor NusG